MDPSEAEKGQAEQKGPGRRTGFWARLFDLFRDETREIKVDESTQDTGSLSSEGRPMFVPPWGKKEEYTRAEIDNVSAKMWGVYVGEAERYDKAVVESWKGDMNGMLIFSGLFSASLTAFLIESYKTLQPDSGDVIVKLLSQMSLQITSRSAAVATVPPFERTAAALICNVLWFISLSLSLTCSLLATLVEQWAREFLHKTEMRPAPVRRARVFSFLYLGLKQFHMHTVVDVIPLLLHISLFLFFGGLVAFLLPVNTVLMYLMGLILAVFFCLYMALTIFPVVRRASPYRTPLSGALWRLKWRLKQFFAKWSVDESSVSTVVKSGDDALHMPSMIEMVAAEALENTGDRDIHAIQWTVMSLTDDDELLPFVEAIPEAIHGHKGFILSNIPLFIPLLMSSDPQLSIGRRITELLRGCDNPLLDPKAQERRRTACLKAQWALGMMIPSSISLQRGACLPFDSNTTFHIYQSVHNDTHRGHFATSATAAVSFSRLNILRRRVKEAVDILRKSDMATEMSRLDCFDRIHELLDGVEDGDLPWKLRQDTGHFHAWKKLSAGIRLVSSAGTSVVSQQIMALKDNVADIAAPRFWQSSFVDIVNSFLGAALNARSCPYMFRETCEKMLDDLGSWHDRSFDSGPDFPYYPLDIPDPESLDQQPLTFDCIHDVDKIVNIILQYLSIFRSSINPSNLWRYIAHREGNSTDYILANCDIETLGRMITDSIKEQLSDTCKGITMDLEVTIVCLLERYPFHIPDSHVHAWSNQVYPYLRDISLSPTTALQVKTIDLDAIEYKLSSLMPPLSLEHMAKVLQEIQDHPLSVAYTVDRDTSASVAQVKINLVSQTMEARLCVASEILVAYSTYDVAEYKGYYVNRLFINSIIGYAVQAFEGPIGFHAQRNFAKAVRTTMHYFVAKPTDYVGSSITEVALGMHGCKWLTDVTSAAILKEAMDLYPVSGYEGAHYFPGETPADFRRLLRDQCSRIIDTDAATNIELLSQLPEFDYLRGSLQVAGGTNPPGFSTSHAPDDAVSRIRAKGHLRDFLCPAFP